MINHKTLRTVANYVAVKLDKDYDTYQFHGKETNIIAPDYEYFTDKDGKQKMLKRKEKNVAVFGEVICAPEKLIFNRGIIRELSDGRTVFRKSPDGIQVIDWSTQKRIDQLRTESVEFDTSIEIEKGDRVNVSYRHYLESEKNGMYADTDIGRIVFIKYDMLKIVVDAENNVKKMLNGYILVEPELVDSKTENGISMVSASGDLVIANPSERYKKSRKNQIGKVVKCGSPVTGYLNDYDTVDPDVVLNEGERILYDPRGAQKLENEIHQVLSDKDWYIVRRRHIWLIQENCINFDDIGLERLR